MTGACACNRSFGAQAAVSNGTATPVDAIFAGLKFAASVARQSPLSLIVRDQHSAELGSATGHDVAISGSTALDRQSKLGGRLI